MLTVLYKNHTHSQERIKLEVTESFQQFVNDGTSSLVNSQRHSEVLRQMTPPGISLRSLVVSAKRATNLYMIHILSYMIHIKSIDIDNSSGVAQLFLFLRFKSIFTQIPQKEEAV